MGQAPQVKSASSTRVAPWLITEAGLQHVAEMSATAATVAPASLAPFSTQRKVRAGVAVIDVRGPLFAHSSMLSNFMAAMGGATTYDDLRVELKAALDDPSVTSILLDIDSPGGEANGCGELAAAIHAARDVKPINAYVGGMAASAAYWIASAASSITCSPTAELGSIGVRMAVVDDSKAQEAAGVQVTNFVSTQSPNKVLDADDDEHKKLFQARVDALADVFVSAVADYRDTTKDAVTERYGRGDVLVGAHAVRAGLADRIGSLDQVLFEQGEPAMKSILSALSLSPTASEGDALTLVMKMNEEHRALLAVTSKETVAEAFATINAWKSTAGEAIALKAKLEEQAAATRATEFDMVMEAATKDGVIPPSVDHPKRQYAVSLKANDNAVAALRSYIQALGPAVSHKPVTAIAPTDVAPALTADELAIAKKMGIKPEALAANKARRLLMVANPNQTDAA